METKVVCCARDVVLGQQPHQDNTSPAGLDSGQNDSAIIGWNKPASPSPIFGPFGQPHKLAGSGDE